MLTAQAVSPHQPSAVQLSVVIPCFNEEENLPELYRRTTAVAKSIFAASYEIVLVDDGSGDDTWRLLSTLASTDSCVVAVQLARNHGHQLALTAGLSVVRGDLVLVIDADLQDPPELLGPMYEIMVRENADVVYGVRRSRAGETRFKKRSANHFYRLLSRLAQVPIPENTGDFRLMTSRIAALLSQMPEHDRFIRGMVAWLGHKQVPFLYDREPRFAGKTKYPIGKMISFAVDALVSFSTVPLRIAIYLAALVTAMMIVIGVYVIIEWLLLGTVPGWASLTLLIIASSAIQLVVLGVIGEYIGRIYMQSKQRPLFLVAKLLRASASGRNEITEVEPASPRKIET
jgi:glycosyltransferase involved in cell wall biosynthesis